MVNGSTICITLIVSNRLGSLINTVLNALDHVKDYVPAANLFLANFLKSYFYSLAPTFLV